MSISVVVKETVKYKNLGFPACEGRKVGNATNGGGKSASDAESKIYKS